MDISDGTWFRVRVGLKEKTLFLIFFKLELLKLFNSSCFSSYFDNVVLFSKARFDSQTPPPYLTHFQLETLKHVSMQEYFQIGLRERKGLLFKMMELY